MIGMFINRFRDVGYGHRVNRVIQLLGLLAIMPGCASLDGKFTGTPEANVGVFADNTIAMLSESSLGFSSGQAIYTREFYALEEAEEKKLLENKAVADKVIGVMLKYSLRLVTIAETEKDEKSRVTAYVEFLDSIDDAAVEALGLERDHYDQLIQKVSTQEKFLDALRVAQPIINAVGRYLELALSDMATAIDNLVIKVDKKIDIEYQDVIRYQEILEAEKFDILAGMEQLYLTSKGDNKAFDRFLDIGVIADPEKLPKGEPKYKDMRIMSDYLLERLDRLHRIGEEIESDWDNYRKAHIELDRLAANAKIEIRQVRLINLVWLRAHQKMASGVVSPAAWFDINEAPKELINMGAKALF